MLKAVLFDMDGVIVDTEPLHHKAYNMMFESFKIEVSDALYQSFTGKSTIDTCRSLCNHFNLNENPELLVQNKRSNFADLFFNDSSLQLIDGVLDVIQDYHKNGITLVLASSASMFTIESVFNRFDLDQYFVDKLSGADLKASKPHPEIFEKAALVSGFNRNECIVIEDSTNGIKAAKTAGIYCVGFDSKHSKNQDYSLADLVINDFKTIPFKKIKTILD